MLFKINPKKLVEKRGNRSRREIVELSGGRINEMNLSYWERETKGWQPSLSKLKVLLEVLPASIEEITDPIDLSVNA